MLTLVSSPCASHQIACCDALERGFKHHGIKVNRASSNALVDTPYVACWGWRAGQKHWDAGRQVLVLERGYIGDRKQWLSLGWNGLNNRATFAEVDDGGARFRRYFDGMLKTPQEGGRYVLLVGQVQGDMSLQGRDLHPWYIDMAERIDNLYGMPVRFRQHPVEVERGLIRHVPNTVYSKDTLENDLANAAVVVTFNSNTATDAVLAGKHTITFDEGAMAWPVTDHLLEIADIYDREQWAYRMAWKQWRVDELASGEGVEKIIEVMP